MSASAYIYASPWMLVEALGIPDDESRSGYIEENQASLFGSLIAGSRYVDYKVGNPVEETDQEAPYSPVEVACPPAWTRATVAAAVRFLRAPEATFGVIGFNATGSSVYARSSLPEVDLLLFGHRTAFGVG